MTTVFQMTRAFSRWSPRREVAPQKNDLRAFTSDRLLMSLDLANLNILTCTVRGSPWNLTSLLENGEIDLLWALFKPNDPVFTTCHGTHKPRCVRCGFDEEKTSKSGSKYWNRYRYGHGKESYTRHNQCYGYRERVRVVEHLN